MTLHDLLRTMVDDDEAEFLIGEMLQKLIGDYPKPKFHIGQLVKIPSCAEHCSHGVIEDVIRKRGREPAYKVERGQGEEQVRWNEWSLEADK